MKPKVLIIDDEKDMLVLLHRILSGKIPHEIITTSDPIEGESLIRTNVFDLVITDLKMPQRDGVQILKSAKEKNPGTAVIVMTAYGTIESAIECTRRGAFDYITKPFRKERLLHVIQQALKWQGLQRENRELRERLQGQDRYPPLVGNSAHMQTLQTQIARVAKTSATVLITGESGTGKELVARAVHFMSPRKEKAFIPIDCSTIPESIIESELFGHLKGSFTGAIKDKKGLVEEADGGTLFLDEIGDLNPTMQVKLLRLLQEGEYKVVGSNSIQRANIRFLAATNQNLEEKIAQGEFREDLFYRLNVINIRVPPLRERKEDIPLLVRHFLEKYNAIHGKSVQKVSEDALRYLVDQEWKGNIRELNNTVERGVIMAQGDALELADILPLPASHEPAPAPSALGRPEEICALPFKEAKDRLLEEFQTLYFNRILSKYEGNVSQAARESGLKRQYLHRLMREINLDSKSFKKPKGSD